MTVINNDGNPREATEDVLRALGNKVSDVDDVVVEPIPPWERTCCAYVLHVDVIVNWCRRGESRIL